MANSQA
ncbi:hypothetical protein YPPY11_4202, partial [Yersinia pestis PY-11]